MKIVFSDAKKGIKKLRVDTKNDLWVISNLINKGDVVEGKSFRSVKFGNKEEKKPVFLSIRVEKVEFSKLKGSLRINGIIVDGKPEEFIQKGRHHTIEVKEGDSISIVKERWLRYENEMIKEAIEESKKPRALIILVDENKMLKAKLLSYGIEEEEIEFHKSKREGSFLKEEDFEFLLKESKDVLVIVGGPGFVKHRLAKFLRKNGYDVRVEEASYVEISGIIELIEKGVLAKAIEENTLSKEAEITAEFEKHLFKEDGLAVYGIREVDNAISIGAVEKLIMLDEFMTKKEYKEIAKKAEKNGGKVFIISSTSPWGKKISSYGGVVAILRFRIS